MERDRESTEKQKILLICSIPVCMGVRSGHTRTKSNHQMGKGTQLTNQVATLAGQTEVLWVLKWEAERGNVCVLMCSL